MATGIDTNTRFEGVYARHSVGCAVEREKRCSCTPRFWGSAWNKKIGRRKKTPMLATPTAARDARKGLLEQFERDEMPARKTLYVKAAVDEFLAACEEGVALNKKRKKYKPKARKNLRSRLYGHFVPTLGTRELGKVRRRDTQKIVDELVRQKRSASTIKNVVNAIRSLYAWAQDRELADHDPGHRVRLPADDETPREYVPPPAVIEELLDALPLRDAVPYAIAAYATARREEIRLIDADDDLDMDLGVSSTWVRTRSRARRATPHAELCRSSSRSPGACATTSCSGRSGRTTPASSVLATRLAGAPACCHLRRCRSGLTRRGRRRTRSARRRRRRSCRG